MATEPGCAARAWSRHHVELKGYLTHRLGDAALADDLLQEVFLRAMRAGERFCHVDDPRAWLFQVARNAVTDHFRLQRPTAPLPDDLPQQRDEVAPVDALAECTERVLAALSPADRDVIACCDLRSMPLAAYAHDHGLTLPAVKSRLQRARVRMRERLISQCNVRFDGTGHVCCHGRRFGN